MARSFVLGGELAIERVGVGTNRIEDNERSKNFLRAALDLGVNFIDTADIYSMRISEPTIGSTIGADPRAVIATKGGYHDGSPENVAKAIEQSRKNLQRDVLDLYYLHKPDDRFPIEQSLDPIVAAKQDGRIRQIGLSNVTLDQIDRVRKFTKVAAVQNVYNLENTENNDVIDYCERHEIAFVPYFPLRSSERADRLAQKLGVPRTRVIIAAMLQRSPVVTPIPGTLNADHLASNIAAADLTIDRHDLEALLDFSAPS